MSEAMQTPMVELLRAVPRDAVKVYESGSGLQSEDKIFAVGRICHEAADELERALQSVEDLTRSLAEMTEERNAFKASSEIRGANIEEMAKVFAELSAYFAGSALDHREMARKTRQMARAALDCSQ